MAARSAEKTDSAAAAARELVITRILDAPRALVWQVWSAPEHMARWSGPRGFSFEVLKLGRQAGDSYRFHMVGPDGAHYWQQGVYREITPGERIVSTFGWTDEHGHPSGPETLLSVSFEDFGGKTRLTLRQTGFDSIPARDGHREGWSSSFECLAEYLESLTQRN